MVNKIIDTKIAMENQEKLSLRTMKKRKKLKIN
jgi:hypothetical protein